MENEKLIVSKGIFRLDNSDGTFTEHKFVMPNCIANDILMRIMSWEEEWTTSTKTHLEYQEEKEKFLFK